MLTLYIALIALMVSIVFGYITVQAIWEASTRWGTAKLIWSIVAIISAIIALSCFAVEVIFGFMSMDMDFWIDLFYKFKF